MKKDTFYFTHDYNARNDVKCLFLRQQLGMEGYGIFWFLVESLADAGGSLPMKIIPVLAMQMQVPDVKVLSVINSFDLFVVTENSFHSNRLNSHIQLRRLLSEKGREGANSRWRNSLPNAEVNSLPNAEANAKESKESKEIKEKSISPIGEDIFSIYKNLEKDKSSISKFIKTKRPDFIEPYKDLWNLFAEKKGRAVVKALNSSRKNKFKVRIREPEFKFLDILKKAGESQWLLTGKWFGFDWIIENDSNYLKILEGNYDNKEPELENNVNERLKAAWGQRIQEAKSIAILDGTFPVK